MSPHLKNYFIRILGVIKTPLVVETTFGKNCFFAETAKISGCRCGDNVNVSDWSALYDSNIQSFVSVQSHVGLFKSTIESYSYVGALSRLAVTSVGRFSSIGPSVISGNGEHPVAYPSMSPVFYSKSGQCGVSYAHNEGFNEMDRVSIGCDCWIGANAVLRNGITIGHGAVVGAGSVVTKDVPPYAVVLGAPARIVKSRFSDSCVTRLLALEWWNWNDDILRDNAEKFVCEDIEVFLDWAEKRAVSSMSES